jgi:uncharacterized protein
MWALNVMIPSISTVARTSRLQFFVVLGLAFYLPIMLMLVGVVPFAYRFHVLLLVSAALAAYAMVQGYGARELGLRTDNLASSFAINAALSGILVALLLGAWALGLIRDPTIPDWSLFFFAYVFAFVPAQEFSCRGFLFGAMERSGIVHGAAQVGVSAVSYAFLHAIYWDALTLAVTLLMGVVWGVVYRLWPNLWGVILSHAVLGVVSIFVGVI